MSVERIEKEIGKESAAKKVADMDSLCEEISRAIVEGLVEKQILDEPEIAPLPENQIAETTVIAPIEGIEVDRMVTTVENLLESDEISQRIVRLVQEKIEQVLNEDVVQSTRGDSGVIAERVHLECTRLFARESFRSDVVDLLRADVEGTIAPTLRRDLSTYIRGALVEVTGLLVERVTGVLRNAREIKLATAPVAPVADAVGEEALVLIVAPDAGEMPVASAPPPRTVRECDARKVAETYSRIRNRLWWEGRL